MGFDMAGGTDPSRDRDPAINTHMGIHSWDSNQFSWMTPNADGLVGAMEANLKICYN